MILWHVATTLFLFRWIFADPKVDVRFLAAGVVLPDIVDMLIGTVVFADRFGSAEIFSHTLVVPTMVASVILMLTRRGRRRRGWMALIVAWFFHLLIDGMWASADVFLWPFFGWDFPIGPQPFWAGMLERAASDPWRWGLELVGLVYLLWVAAASGLGDAERRADFIESGRLRPLEHPADV